MELELNAATQKALAKEIARAQLTAADELIDEVTSTWPESVRAKYHVAAPGETTREGRVITQQERYEIFRSMRGGAAGMMQREAQEAEKGKAEMTASIARREADELAQIEKHKLENKARLSRYEADRSAAVANGLVEPQKPPLLPETPEGVVQAAYRQHTKNIF